jgi:hypothetical protein
MSELKRWILSDAPPDVARMLRAAQVDGPKGTLVDRTLAACGTGAAVAGLTHSAAAAGTVGAATVPGVGGVTAALVKWTLIGALAAGGVTGSALGIRELSRPAPRSVPAAQGQRARPAHAPRVGTRTAASEAVTAPGPSPAAPNTVSSGSLRTLGTARTDGDATLVAEVTAIDEARSAVARGDARGALRVLDGYEQRFHKRHLAPEALYLRMQAHHQLGDRAGARACATRLVSRYPSAPQVGRALELLSDQKR